MKRAFLLFFVWNISILAIWFLSSNRKLCFEKKGEAEEKGQASMYALKADVFPSVLIVLMGSIDAITTVIGVMYFGASELNPFMTGIVNTNIAAFLALKVSATFLIGFTYILAKRTLNKSFNKESRAFRYSNGLMKVAYAGLMVFLIIVVINNLTILLT